MKTIKNKLLVLTLATLPVAGYTQVNNLDFETWDHPVIDQVFSNLPTGWLMLSPGNAEPSVLDVFYLPPATDAQNGTYALTVSVWYNYTKDVAIQTAAYSSRPTALKGFYKYTQNSIWAQSGEISDLAQVGVYLTKWNSAAHHRDTIGTGILDLGAAVEYTSFTNAITYTDASTLPDSIRIIADPSLLRRKNSDGTLISQDGTSSFFTIDNLSFTHEQTAGLQEWSSLYKIYPNPAADLLHIEGFEGSIELFDVNGRHLQTEELGFQEPFPMNHLQTGVYMLRLNDGKQIGQLRIVKK
ncbi:hypothetical protein D3C87_21150 [compost metagenome]